MSYRVAIVSPKTRNIFDTNEPLNIITIATYLKKAGITVKIIDELAGDDFIKEVDDFNPGLIGFTATTCVYYRAVQLLKLIKPKGIATVIGGVHASTLPQEALADGFDMVVVGEGEKALLDIIRSGAKSGIFKTPAKEVLNADEIPIPDRGLINMDFYSRTKERSPHDPNLDFVPFRSPMATMITSRGCPINCIFCHNTWRGTPLRFLPAERMIEEVEKLIYDYDIHYIWFFDDNFFLIKDRAVKFCELLLRKRIKIFWATSTRADSVSQNEIVELASRAGCRRISFGFESGSQRILDVLGKKSKVEDNLAAAELCNKHNIEVSGLFMVGNPTETREDIRLTWEFIKKAKLDSIAVNITTPFPGTVLWDWCRERGYIPSHMDYSSFYFTHAPIQIPDTFTPREVENIKRKMLVKAYLFHPKLRNRFLEKMVRHPLLMFEKILDYMPFAKTGAHF